MHPMKRKNIWKDWITKSYSGRKYKDITEWG
uniref:Uncharacterized protein n=1 Tax=Rhizophora mucronata TaxID=61149 RepID=A0A2P2IK23_RHIMU